jgi:hypothetical protein
MAKPNNLPMAERMRLQKRIVHILVDWYDNAVLHVVVAMRELRLLPGDVTDEQAELLRELFIQGVHGLMRDMTMEQLEDFIVDNADAETILARLHQELLE